jgi:hypothetical protein
MPDEKPVHEALFRPGFLVFPDRIRAAVSGKGDRWVPGDDAATGQVYAMRAKTQRTQMYGCLRKGWLHSWRAASGQG